MPALASIYAGAGPSPYLHYRAEATATAPTKITRKTALKTAAKCLGGPRDVSIAAFLTSLTLTGEGLNHVEERSPPPPALQHSL